MQSEPRKVVVVRRLQEATRSSHPFVLLYLRCHPLAIGQWQEHRRHSHWDSASDARSMAFIYAQPRDRQHQTWRRQNADGRENSRFVAVNKLRRFIYLAAGKLTRDDTRPYCGTSPTVSASPTVAHNGCYDVDTGNLRRLIVNSCSIRP